MINLRDFLRPIRYGVNIALHYNGELLELTFQFHDMEAGNYFIKSVWIKDDTLHIELTREGVMY